MEPQPSTSSVSRAKRPRRQPNYYSNKALTEKDLLELVENSDLEFSDFEESPSEYEYSGSSESSSSKSTTHPNNEQLLSEEEPNEANTTLGSNLEVN